MDDRSQVEQPPIQITYSGTAAFRTVKDLYVPDPPEGCESEQLLDWAGVMAIIAVKIARSRQARVIEVYATKWGIDTIDKA